MLPGSEFRSYFIPFGGLGFYAGYLVASLLGPNTSGWIRLFIWPVIFTVNALFYGLLARAFLWALRDNEKSLTSERS